MAKKRETLKTIIINYEDIRLSKAKYEIMKDFMLYGENFDTKTEFAVFFCEKHGYSVDYIQSVISSMKDLLHKISINNFRVHAVVIPFGTIMKYWSKKGSTARVKKTNELTF